jgi:hypothetical protein
LHAEVPAQQILSAQLNSQAALALERQERGQVGGQRGSA